MAHWEYTLNLRDIWKEPGIPFDKMRDAVVQRIVDSDFWKDTLEFDLEANYELTSIVEDMSMSRNMREFNLAWSDFYDFADEHRIWVATA